MIIFSAVCDDGPFDDGELLISLLHEVLHSQWERRRDNLLPPFIYRLCLYNKGIKNTKKESLGCCLRSITVLCSITM